MVAKNKYGKGVLTNTFISLLLKYCLAMIQNQEKYTLKLLLMCLKVGGWGGFWNMLCQRANDFNWGELALGQLGVGGNHGLMKFLQVNVTIFRNIFKWWLLLMSI